jgi:xyloglucan-specific endo-beta-1,4-glucanase
MDPIGSPIANTSIAGYTWQLWEGVNQGWTVFSFLRQGSDIENFSGDLNGFYQYLIDYQGVQSSQYLVALESGTEPITVSSPHRSSYREITDHWTGIGYSCHEFVQRCG